ncbi:MAG: hypothetical protein U9R28_05020, partial [Pseudomonadota bacterium]|nr:hypothetical protein [Pseudomonadota bacterium]
METFDLDKLLSFIHQSPIVVAIGFIASVLTIIAFFKTRAWIKNTVISQQKTNVNGPQVAQPNAEIKNQNISGNHIHNGPNYGSLYQGPFTFVFCWLITVFFIQA